MEPYLLNFDSILLTVDLVIAERRSSVAPGSLKALKLLTTAIVNEFSACGILFFRLNDNVHLNFFVLLIRRDDPLSPLYPGIPRV